jgi:hypothetical protein
MPHPLVTIKRGNFAAQIQIPALPTISEVVGWFPFI